ncbi:MAG: diguanylate cyclase [Terriglobales bacterium]
MKIQERVLTFPHAERSHGWEPPLPAPPDGVDPAAWLTALVESADDAIIGLAPNRTIVSWNRGAGRLYGYTAEEAIGHSFALLIPRPSSGGLVQLMARVRKAARWGSYKTIHARKDGASLRVSVVIAPVQDGTGRVIGASAIIRHATPRRPGLQPGRARLRLAGADTNAGKDAEPQNGETHQLQQLCKFLHACRTAEEARTLLMRVLPLLFPGTAGALYTLPPGLNLLEAGLTWGESPLGEMVFTAEECWALRHGQMHAGGNASAAPCCPHLDGLGAAGSVCVPLTAAGEVLGALTLLTATDGPNCPSRDWIEAAAGQIALALSNLRLRETLVAQTVRDPLTGLYNRRFLDETLPREILLAARNHTWVGVAICDLDCFKHINDTRGHAAGDALLRTFAGLIGDVTRATDTAYRVGGDEFVLILPGAALQAARRRVEGLRQAFARAATMQFGEPATLSLGISCYPLDGADQQELLQAADEALYRAKAKGGNRVAVAAGRP